MITKAQIQGIDPHRLMQVAENMDCQLTVRQLLECIRTGVVPLIAYSVFATALGLTSKTPQQQAIDAIKANGTATYKSLSDAIHVPEFVARRLLNQLVDASIATKQRHNRTVYFSMSQNHA